MGIRTASSSGCGFPKFSSTWFTAGRYLRLLEVKFSYLRDRVKRAYTFHSPTHLHTLKLSTESGHGLHGEGIANSLADTNISNLAFVNQLFQFLPCGVRIRSQRFINHNLVLSLFECNWPAAIRLSSMEVMTDRSLTHQ